MRLAVVTPLDANSTGVADYSLDLLPHLARAAGHTIIVLSQSLDQPQTQRSDSWTWQPITALPRIISEVDLVIYQMGNSPAHDFMAPSLHTYPGLVVLHDLSLVNFYARQATQAGHRATYLRAFGFGYGTEGTRLARHYLQQDTFLGYPEYLASEWLAARSPGIIVHSNHACAVLSERCPAARVWMVPMPVPVPNQITTAEARARLGLPSDVYLIAAFGAINLSKNPIAILDTLACLRAAHVPAQVVFIGKENSPFRLMPEIERRKLQANVTLSGFVDDLDAVHLWLSAADVAVSLRSPYWGETPASALRILASGVPLITSDVGAFAELPDAACVKLTPNAPDTTGKLCSALDDLYRRPDRQQAMGAAARDYVTREHAPSEVADRYIRVACAILNAE